MRERVEQHAIDCHLTWGYVHAAARPSHMDGLKQYKEQLERYGVTGLAMLSRTKPGPRSPLTPTTAGSTKRGPGTSMCWSMRWAWREAVLAKGGQVFENTRVTGWRTGSRPR
jgi:gamma-glutamylputrescine oxidase